MPKLLSLHLSDIGPKAARFRNVEIPLTDKQNSLEPVDSFIWLRNGGGKGVCKSLYYSLFRPSLHEFVGKLSGERRHIRDMIPTRGVAVIATEWTVPGSQPRLDGTRDTRVIAQALAWPGGQYRSDALPSRCFFSFKTDGTNITMQSLPLRGRPHHARTLRDLQDWFENTVRERPDLEPVWYSDGQQRDWMAFLDSCHFDLEGFRIQLQMNKTEGGAGQEILSFDREEEFLDVVLQSLMDEQGLQDKRDFLVGVREKIEQRPQLEAEVALFSALKERLEAVVQAGQARDQAQERLEATRGGLRTIAARALAHKGLLESDIEVSRQRYRAVETTRDECSTRAITAERRGNGARLRAAELENDAAEAEKQRARQRLDSAHRARQLGEVVVELMARNARQREVQNLERRIAELSEPKRLKYEALIAAAARFATVVDKRIASAQQTYHQAEADVSAAKTAHSDAQSAEVKAQSDVTSLNREIDQLNGRLRAAEEARNQLRRDGLLSDEDSPEAAREAREQARQAEAGRRAEAARLEEKAERDLERIRQDLAAAKDQLDAARTAEANARSARDAFRAAHDRIAGDPTLCEIQDADSANPYAPGLPYRVQDRITKLDQSRKTAEREREDALDDLNAMDAHNGLLPASKDIQRVRAVLEEAGITAMGYPEYLRSQTYESDRIAELIRRDPARYGGLAVVGPDQYARAAEAVAQVENLRSPVQITFVGAEELPETDGRTVLPVHPATYRKESALELREQLQGRYEDLGTRIEALENALEAARTSLRNLRDFLDTHPENTEAELEQALERAAGDTAARQEAYDALNRTYADTHTEHGRQRDARKGAEKAEAELAEKIRRLDMHIARHEADLPDVRARLEAAGRELSSAEETQTRAAQARQEAQQRLDAANEALSNADERLQAHQRRRQDVDAYAQGRRDTPEDEAAAETDFEAAESDYRAETGPERLQGELESAKRELEDAREKADKAMRRLRREGYDPQEAEQEAARASETPDLEQLRRREREADIAFNDAKNALQSAQQAVETARAAGEIERPEGSENWTVADCRSAADRFDSEYVSAIAERDRQEERLRQLNESIQAALGQVQRLDSAAQKAALVLKEELDTIEPVHLERGDLPDIDSYDREIDTARQDLTRVERALDDRRKELQRATAQVRKVLDNSQYQGVADRLRDRIREQLDNIDQAARTFCEECETAVAAKRQQIETIEQDEAELVRQFDSQLNDLKQKISKLAPCSKVPEGVGDWSGHNFFYVGIDSELDSDEARRAMIRDYIRRLVSNPDMRIPSPPDLMRQCAHAVFDNHLTLKAFKPALGFPRGYHRMMDILTSSGGEKLTAAVMIYMALDRVSSLYRRGAGSSAGEGRTLLLDNPIGPCNLTSFLDAQRKVAAACNIQLVILSGINDTGVVGLYPRVVTIQNLLKDTSTNENVVQVAPDTQEQGLTTATVAFDQNQIAMPQEIGGPAEAPEAEARGAEAPDAEDSEADENAPAAASAQRPEADEATADDAAADDGAGDAEDDAAEDGARSHG